MKVPILKVLVKKDVYTTLPLEVPPQELVVLGLIYGQQNLKDIELVPDSEVEMDPNEEYGRLLRKYKNNPKGEPWTIIAFGQPHEGRIGTTMKSGAAHYLKKKPRPAGRVAESPAA